MVYLGLRSCGLSAQPGPTAGWTGSAAACKRRRLEDEQRALMKRNSAQIHHLLHSENNHVFFWVLKIMFLFPKLAFLWVDASFLAFCLHLYSPSSQTHLPYLETFHHVKALTPRPHAQACRAPSQLLLMAGEHQTSVLPKSVAQPPDGAACCLRSWEWVARKLMTPFLKTYISDLFPQISCILPLPPPHFQLMISCLISLIKLKSH